MEDQRLLELLEHIQSLYEQGKHVLVVCRYMKEAEQFRTVLKCRGVYTWEHFQTRSNAGGHIMLTSAGSQIVAGSYDYVVCDKRIECGFVDSCIIPAVACHGELRYEYL